MSFSMCIIIFNAYTLSCFTDNGMVNINDVMDKGSLFTGGSLVIDEHLLSEPK